MRNKKVHKRNSGQSLFELVIAIGVVSLILLTLVSLATLSVRNASFARNEAEAARLGQETAEWLRRERDANWDTFVFETTSSPVQCVMSLSWEGTLSGPCTPNDTIETIFLREADFRCQTDCTINNNNFIDRIEAIIKVSWTDGQGQHEVRNSTYFSDLRVQ